MFEYEYNDRRKTIQTLHRCGLDEDIYKISYSGDYSEQATYNSMCARNMTGIPIERLRIRSGKVVESYLTEYAGFTNMYLPRFEWSAELGDGVPYESFTRFNGAVRDTHYVSWDKSYFSYNHCGNPTGIVDRDGVSSSILWGYGGKYPIFVARNLNVTDCTYRSFESSPDAVDGGFFSDKSHLGVVTVGLSVIDTSKTYCLDYRIETVSGDWQYVRMNYTGGVLSLGVPGLRIDEIRIYPSDAEVYSCTYYDGLGVRSITDSRGVTRSYRYDGMGRLCEVLNNNGDSISEYEYNYPNQIPVF